jgi:ankyrin repeat protein
MNEPVRKDIQLFRAAGAGLSSEVDSLLLAKDAVAMNVNFANTANQTAFFAACHHGHTSVIASLLACERVDVNIKETAENLACPRVDVNATEKLRNTAMHLATELDLTSTVRLFAACSRVDVNAKTVNGCTALIRAAELGYDSTVAALLTCARVDINTINEEGFSAIYYAAYHGHSLTVNLLASAGAILHSPAVESTSGRNLVSMVVDSFAPPEKQATMLAMLKKHGIIVNNDVPRGFQSKYYFQDGQGESSTRGT